MKLSDRPLFSIAIPAYKSTFLKECIDSALNQTYNNFEIVIVNDASPEALDTIVNQYKDSRINYYVNDKNCGSINVVDNWNICLSYCKGDYIICIGDDDKLLPCCLEEYVKIIDKYPNLGVYHAWTELIDENSNHLNMTPPRAEYESCMSLIWNRWHGYTNQYIGDFCFDIKQLRADGGFFKQPLAWASDDITAVRAARIAGIANTQVLCFQYRENTSTISSTGSSKTKADAIFSERNWYKDFFANYNAAKGTTDELFYLENKSYIDQHFRDKFKRLLSDDMQNHPDHIFKWIKRHRYYGISLVRVIYAFKMGFESRFHGK